MFGLSKLEAQLAGGAIVLLILLIATGLFAWHERSLGAAKCIQGDIQATQKQQAHNAAVEAQGTTTVFQEAQEFHAETTAPIAHPVQLRVCHPSSAGAVSHSDSTGSLRNDSTALSGSGDTASVSSEPIGPQLQGVGRAADAQIRELQDYVLKVCTAR